MKPFVEHLLNGKEKDSPGHQNHRREQKDDQVQDRDLYRRTWQRLHQRKQGTLGWGDTPHFHTDP